MKSENEGLKSDTGLFPIFLKTHARLLFCLYIVVALLSSYISCLDGGDMDYFLYAGRQLVRRENIYDKGLLYSVFFSTMLSPFAFHVFITEFVWLLFSFGLIIRTGLLIFSYFNMSKFSDKQKKILLFLAFLLSIQFIMYEISLIQITIFLLWAMLESLNFIENDKPLIGGMLLALAINIKLMPLLIIPYLFYRGYFRAIFACILFFGFLLFFPALFIGNDYNSFLLKKWFLTINPQNKENVSETYLTTHSIVSLLTVYLTETPFVSELPYKRNFLSVNFQTLGIVINIARLFLFSFSFFFFRTRPFMKEENKLKRFWEFSYFMLLIPLTFPHQNKYDFLLALPMIIYMLYFYISTFSSINKVSYKISFAMFVFAMIVFSPIYGSDLIGAFLFKLTQHYKVMTFSALLLIPIALYCNPSKLDT